MHDFWSIFAPKLCKVALKGDENVTSFWWTFHPPSVKFSSASAPTEGKKKVNISSVLEGGGQEGPNEATEDLDGEDSEEKQPNS